ncbi:MAG: hypothetical protein U0228_27670 [Myxococcaceae bacterium]
MLTLLATLAVAASPDTALQQALQKALLRSPARVELETWDAPLRCRGQFVPAPFESSGRVAVKVKGKNCEAWGWANVKVIVPVARLIKEVKPEQSLDGAWALVDAEPSPGELDAVPMGAVATRALRPGEAVRERDVRFGPKPGTRVTVKVIVGALSIEQAATVSPCSGVATCATLSTGKRVAGTWIDNALLVQEVP